jgi:hypothetical protein
MSAAVDESCQLLVVAIDINPNQLLFARQPGMLPADKAIEFSFLVRKLCPWLA